MKIIKHNLRLIIVLVIMGFYPYLAHSQSTGPGDPNGGGPIGPPVGGDAPIGSGLLILIGLGAAYGGKKVYYLNKEEAEK